MSTPTVRLCKDNCRQAAVLTFGAMADEAGATAGGGHQQQSSLLDSHCQPDLWHSDPNLNDALDVESAEIARMLASLELEAPVSGPATSVSPAAAPALHTRSRSAALQHWEHAQLTSLAATHIHPTAKRKQ